MQDGQGALAQLSGTLDKLQPLAEQLDPLETPYADVRFLDVDYEQTEQQYDQIMDALRNEIDEENELVEQTKQLEAEVINLHGTMQPEIMEDVSRYHDQILPPLYARLNDINQRNVVAKKRRRVVQPAAAPGKAETMLRELGNLLDRSAAHLTERKQQSEIEEIRRILQQLEQDPTMGAIEEAESKLEKLGFSNDAVEELRRTLKEMRHKLSEMEKLKQKAEIELAELSQKMEDMREKCQVVSKETKSKKRKKGQQKPKASPQSRKEEIHELRKNVHELQTVIIPALTALGEQLAAADIQNIQPGVQSSQAAELIQSLTVSRIIFHVFRHLKPLNN